MRIDGTRSDQPWDQQRTVSVHTRLDEWLVGRLREWCLSEVPGYLEALPDMRMLKVFMWMKLDKMEGHEISSGTYTSGIRLGLGGHRPISTQEVED